MKIFLEDTRIITYTEYRNLLDLYHQQMTKTAELQDENTALHNLIVDLRKSVHNSKKRPRRSV